jgi:hypothetical protein
METTIGPRFILPATYEKIPREASSSLQKLTRNYMHSITESS